MHNARENQQSTDPTAAKKLAELVLSLAMVTTDGLAAKRLAREVLGLTPTSDQENSVTLITNGATRVIPRDEPLFLIRGQDMLGASTIRAWAELANNAGASQDILDAALEQAAAMDAWPIKKIPDKTI